MRWRTRHPASPRAFKCRSSESGMVSVELAIGLAVVAIILTLVVAITAVGIGRTRTCQAARDAARMAAIGDDATAVTDTTVTIAHNGSWVTATASTPVGLPLLASAQLTCSVTTIKEQAAM